MSLDRFGVTKLFPTITNGRTWYSTAWKNGKNRTLIPNQFDPSDSNLGITSANLQINGNGIATSSPGSIAISQRIYINGPWRNTEATFYKKVRGTCDSLQLRSRSNHHGVKALPYGYVKINNLVTSCGFGNYLTKWGEAGDTSVSTEVEVIHNLYKRHLDQRISNKPPNNTWIGYKQVTRDVGLKVQVQGYICRDVTKQVWTKETEFIFDGTNVHVDPGQYIDNVNYCIDKPDKVAVDIDKNTVWQHSGKWFWIRMNNVKDVDLKFFSVREIAAI